MAAGEFCQMFCFSNVFELKVLHCRFLGEKVSALDFCLKEVCMKPDVESTRPQARLRAGEGAGQAGGAA